MCVMLSFMLCYVMLCYVCIIGGIIKMEITHKSCSSGFISSSATPLTACRYCQAVLAMTYTTRVDQVALWEQGMGWVMQWKEREQEREKERGVG